MMEMFPHIYIFYKDTGVSNKKPYRGFRKMF